MSLRIFLLIQCCKEFDIMLQVSINNIPTRQYKNKISSIPRERKNLMRRRSRINKRMLKVTSPTKKEKLKTELLDIEVKLYKSRKKTKFAEEKKAISSIKKNPKFFYSYAKRFSTTNNSIGPLKDEDGKYVYDNDKIAQLFSKQYKSVFNKPDEDLPPASEMFPDDMLDSLTDIPFTRKDIIDSIDELSNNSASGPDNVAAHLLKNCKDELSPALYLLWRKCLDEGVTPSQLKHPEVIPIYKGGDMATPANFRPVSLTSHIIKVFEKVIKKYLVEYLTEKNLFSENQHGFRKGRSCLSQLLLHYEEILSSLASGKEVDVIYLDFCKAFDKVDFLSLLKKLKKLGIGGKIGRWVHSFLIARKQVVRVNGTYSSEEDVLSGVPQGSVLGPLLFIIYVSDIDEALKHSTLRCFADDSRMMKPIDDVNDNNLLQNDLMSVYEWTDTNKMKLNNTKLEMLHYSQGNEFVNQYTAPDGTHISNKEWVKDLGIIMSNDASFTTHIDHVTLKLRNMAAWILRTFQSREREVLMTMWKSLALPIHDYCSQLWSPSKKGEIQKLENVQRSFVRKVKSLDNLNYWQRLEALKLLSLERRRERYQILYIHKVITKLVPGISLASSGTGIDIKTDSSTRPGFKLAVPKTIKCATSGKTKFCNMKENSFTTHAVKLFNVLPRAIRNNCLQMTPNQMKANVDKCLELIPDEPQVIGYNSRCQSNSLLHMVPQVMRDEQLLMKTLKKYTNFKLLSRGGSPASPL